MIASRIGRTPPPRLRWLTTIAAVCSTGIGGIPRTPPSNPRPINVVNGIRFVSARLGGGEHPGEVLKKDGLAAPRLTDHHGPRASAVAENRVQPGQRPTPGQHRRLEFLA